MRPTRVFEQRAVAFLDILGFSALIAQAEQEPDHLQDLFGLRNVLDSHVRWDNVQLDSNVPEAVKPRYIFISDSLILSAPPRHQRPDGLEYDGLAVVVLKTIQIAHKLLEMGFLLRGGISVGSVWQDDRNIFGTGYIAAVNAEKAADYPRILLTDVAQRHWQQNSLAHMPLSETHMCVADGDTLVVDTLCPEYILGTDIHGRIEGAFGQYRRWIATRLSELPTGRSARSKWEWMATFFNRAVRQHGVGVPPFDTLPIPP